MPESRTTESLKIYHTGRIREIRTASSPLGALNSTEKRLCRRSQCKLLISVSTVLMITTNMFAAIGDSAPPIPTTYQQSHPRIGAPSNSNLTSLCGASGGVCAGASFSRFQTAITNWDANCITFSCGAEISFRYLLMGCLAKIQGGVSTADCKPKLDSLVDMAGTIGPLYLSDNNGSASCSMFPCTVTDTSVNFTTGCNAGSCAGYLVGIQGFYYQISTVTATTITLSQGFLNEPAPTGSNLRLRLSTGFIANAFSALYTAMLYDWMYYSGGPASATMTQLSVLRTALSNVCYLARQDYLINNATGSPINDQFYEWSGWGAASAAFALYPDVASAGTVAEPPAFYVNFYTDVLLNQVLPFWQFVMLGDGKCVNASTCADGGAQAEDWNGYDANVSTGITFYWYTLPFIAWANASGITVNTFFTVNYPWMKNYAYETMYFARPDFTADKLTFSNGYMASSGTGSATLEYQGCGNGNDFGSLLALGVIYADGHIIDWARKGNLETVAICSTMTDGFEPSGWPYMTPDSTANNAILHDRSDLPNCRNFTGFGVLVCRNWTETAPYVSIKYKGCEWFSHCSFDAGQFEIYRSGSLAVIPCPYRPGTASFYFNYFCQNSIAHNVPRIFDSGDTAAQIILACNATDNCSSQFHCQAEPNDGGQRRMGSNLQNFWNNSSCGSKTGHVYALDSPINLPMWQTSYWTYQTSSVLAYATSAAYTYLAVDITPAYNIPRSLSSPDINQRTMRVAKVTRQFLYIPSKNSDTVIFDVFDQIHNSGSALPKSEVIHSINQPSISGNTFTISRTENVSGVNGTGGLTAYWPNSWFGPGGDNLIANINSTAPCSIGGTAPLGTNMCYQYGGQLKGWWVFPSSLGTLTTIGGATHFADDGSGGIAATGTNWDQALLTRGADAGGSWGYGDTNLGCTLDHLCPNNAHGPLEPGMWRLEAFPSSQTNVSEQFEAIMYASAPGDSDIPTSVTGATTGSAPTRTYTTTVNMALGCVWTIVHNENGIASTLSNNGNANCPENLP